MTESGGERWRKALRLNSCTGEMGAGLGYLVSGVWVYYSKERLYFWVHASDSLGLPTHLHGKQDSE